LFLIPVPEPGKTSGDKNITLSEELNIDKLAYAVAQAETNNCTKGASLSKNNCFGIMHWPNGKRQLKYYESPQDSYAEFKRIWTTHYKEFPDYRLADKYTGGDNTSQWLANVNKYYYN